MRAIPVEQLRAAIRLLWPDEITPQAKRLLEQLCEQAAPLDVTDEVLAGMREIPAPTACEWCGRAIRQVDGAWLAVKGAERGYEPDDCDANPHYTWHSPSSASGTYPLLPPPQTAPDVTQSNRPEATE